MARKQATPEGQMGFEHMQMLTMAQTLRSQLETLESFLGRSQTGTDDTPRRPQIRQPEDVARLLQPEMAELEQEQLRVVLLDNQNGVIDILTIYQGTVNTIGTVSPRDIFREAVRANAVAVIVAHNHPSGQATPSPEDIRATRALVAAGKVLDIEVLDHLVIARHETRSIRQHLGSGAGF